MYKKSIFKFCGAIACGAIVYKNWSDFNRKPVYALTNLAKYNYPTSAEYPEVHFNRNIMSRKLTDTLYAKLRLKKTSNGFTLDEAIQTGVDNIGKYTTPGIVAGDEESYKVFSELFDLIIEEKHAGYKKTQEHKTNLNANDLIINEPFDSNYVLNCRIKTIRNIRGFCFPTFCSRGERRDIETLFVKIFYDFADNKPFKYKGTYYPINLLSDQEEDNLKQYGFWLERPYTSREISANLFRDWPDARGIWLDDDKNICVYLNRKDHCLITVHENSSDFKKAFESFSNFMNEVESHLKDHKFEFMHNKHLGYLTSSPSNLGTALKLSVRMKIPNLSQDSRLVAVLKKLDLNLNYRLFNKDNQQIKVDDADKDTIVEISSFCTLGKSEVEIAQSFANSINKLIDLEKKIQNGDSLNDAL